jgi:hypothetical protein
MATFTHYPKMDDTTFAQANGANAAGYPMPTVIEGTYDAGMQTLAAGDIVELIEIPRGCIVYNCVTEVLTEEAGASIAVADANAVAWATVDMTTANTVALGAGTATFYDEDTLVTLTATTDVLVGKVRVFFHCVPFGVTAVEAE